MPRLYRKVRSEADYAWSLKHLERFGEVHPGVLTKSGLMVGVGETDDEIVEVMHDLHAHGCSMLTVGQYLQPSCGHLPVERFVEPAKLEEFRRTGEAIGLANVANGPLVRSSYHADRQAAELA